MTKTEAIAILKEDNLSTSVAQLEMYAGCFIDYQEAAENIAKNGTIVAHPRTGAPIENPYFKIKTATMKSLLAFRCLKTNRLWQKEPSGQP